MYAALFVFFFPGSNLGCQLSQNSAGNWPICLVWPPLPRMPVTTRTIDIFKKGKPVNLYSPLSLPPEGVSIDFKFYDDYKKNKMYLHHCMMYMKKLDIWYVTQCSCVKIPDKNSSQTPDLTTLFLHHHTLTTQFTHHPKCKGPRPAHLQVLVHPWRYLVHLQHASGMFRSNNANTVISSSSSTSPCHWQHGLLLL